MRLPARNLRAAFDAFMRLVIVRRVGWPVIGHLVVMQPQASALWHRQRPILRKSARRHRHSMLPREHLFVQCQEWQNASELPSKRCVYGGGTDWCHPLCAQLHTQPTASGTFRGAQASSLTCCAPSVRAIVVLNSRWHRRTAVARWRNCSPSNRSARARRCIAMLSQQRLVAAV